MRFLQSRYVPDAHVSLSKQPSSLLTEAERYLESPLRSVMDKASVAASGDRHDYVSLAKYTWPNPNTSDGLPYVHRDGRTNPEVKAYDASAWHETSRAVQTLCRAAQQFGRSDFVNAAAQRIDCWFLSSATRMNPHLRYAQFVPGMSHGRPYGIIEWSGSLPAMIEAWSVVALPQPDRAFREWCEALLDWLLESDFGQQAAEYTNNHAVFFDGLTAYLSLWLDRKAQAKHILEQVPARRIVAQIEPDGRMPRELKRTKSLSYTCMNLSGLFRLATLGEHVGLDLWRWESEDGRSIQAAVKFLYDHAQSTEPWPYEQIDVFPYPNVIRLIQLAEKVYGSSFDVESCRHRLN